MPLFAWVAPRVGPPNPVAANANRAKRGPLVLLWAKSVQLVVLVNFVQAKTLTAMLRIPLFVSIAPRVGLPKPEAQNVNRVKPVPLVLL